MRESTFYGCVSCYPPWVARVPFDLAAMTDAFAERVIEPALSLQAALARLYISESPAEMTVDPLIVPNPDLPAVREAQGQRNCQRRSWRDAVQWVTLSDGAMIAGYSVDADRAGAAPEVPAAIRVEQLSTSGPPLVVVDNTAASLAAVDAHNDLVFDAWRVEGLLPPGAADPIPDQAPAAADPGADPSNLLARGCDTAPGRSVVAALIALAALRRRNLA